MDGGFGQCPKCGKFSLVIAARWEEAYWAYIIVKCINCGYEEKIEVEK